MDKTVEKNHSAIKSNINHRTTTKRPQNNFSLFYNAQIHNVLCALFFVPFYWRPQLPQYIFALQASQ